MRHGTNDFASEIECASSGERSSSSKVNDFEGSVMKQAKEVSLAYIFERARNDVDDNVTVVLVHAFFPENFDDNLGAVVESNT